jgi:large subunit ribosomal protein L25
MEAIYLESTVRESSEIGRTSSLRKKNFVACVVYGEGKKTLPLKIERGHLIKFMHAHHGGENIVITLKVADPESKKPLEKPVIIKEIQTHPVSGELLHVDFNEISLTKRIIVKVPIHSIGEPIGVKQDGGTLEHVLWEVEVECLPTQIPEKLEADVTNMKIGDTVQVKDLKVPEGAVIKHEGDAIVFNVVPPYKEELPVEAAAEAAPSSEPELIKKEKKPVEGAEEEAAKTAKPETKEK